MDALVPALIAILLCETGGKMQALVHGAAVGGRSGAAILSALLATTAIGLGVSAFAGAAVAHYMNADARMLLAGLALVFAGAPMLLPRRKKPVASPRFLLPAFAIAQFGDSAQFIVFAIAAQAKMSVFAALGGMLGVMGAAIPPLAMRHEWPGTLPLGTARLLAGSILLLGGAWLALRALRLV